MADRHNTCINPAVSVDATGWGEGGGGVGVRTAVTDFQSDFAARYTTDDYIRTAKGAVVAGLTYTFSVYVRDQIGWGGSFNIEWVQANNDTSYSGSSFQLVAGVPTRISITAEAPTGAVFGRMTIEDMREGSLSNTADVSCMLIEQVGTVEDYFDGDSDGASWDGTTGLSSSTLSEGGGSTVEGDVTATLTASATATAANAAVGAATQAVTHNRTATGANAAAGASTVATTHNRTATGANAAQGTATQAVTHNRTATGTSAAVGGATQAITHGRTATGTNAAVGAAEATITRTPTAEAGSQSVEGSVTATTTSATTVAGANSAVAGATQAVNRTASAAAVNSAIGASSPTIVHAVALAASTAPIVGGEVELIITARVTATAVVTAGEVPDDSPIATGGWYSLISILREAEDQRRAEADQPPQACPHDGEPLVAGPGGVLFCKFDGWEYPRDYVRPAA